jgi:conjugal transfer pilus assembly protein TraU
MIDLILNPEAVLFANPIAQAACARIASRRRSGSGCRNSSGAPAARSVYPLDGHVAVHLGGCRPRC